MGLREEAARINAEERRAEEEELREEAARVNAEEQPGEANGNWCGAVSSCFSFSPDNCSGAFDRIHYFGDRSTQ